MMQLVAYFYVGLGLWLVATSWYGWHLLRAPEPIAPMEPEILPPDPVLKTIEAKVSELQDQQRRLRVAFDNQRALPAPRPRPVFTCTSSLGDYNNWTT